MAFVIEETSTITAKGQTTVPKAVRQALGVDYGGRIAFRIDGAGVSVHRIDEAQGDPALDSFLDFLARDIQKRPEALASMAPSLRARMAELTKGMQVDLDAPIVGDVDL